GYLGLKGPVTIPQQNGHCPIGVVGYRKVNFAITIEVSHGDGFGALSHGEVGLAEYEAWTRVEYIKPHRELGSASPRRGIYRCDHHRARSRDVRRQNRHG